VSNELSIEFKTFNTKTQRLASVMVLENTCCCSRVSCCCCWPSSIPRFLLLALTDAAALPADILKNEL
jgi:hypothetical protein